MAPAIGRCIEWQRVGLKSPQRVRDATHAYLRSQDLFNSWMEENCETGANRRENRTNLFGPLRFTARSRAVTQGQPMTSIVSWNSADTYRHPKV